MIFNVDVPLHFAGHIGRDQDLQFADPLFGRPCSSCGKPLGEDNRPVVRVAISIARNMPNPRGWSLSGSVVVHAACARGGGADA